MIRFALLLAVLFTALPAHALDVAPNDQSQISPTTAALEDIAKGLRAYLPTEVDKVTTLTDIKIEGADMLVYQYSLPTEIYYSHGMEDSMAVAIPEAMHERFCTPEPNEFMDLKAKIIYRYIDENAQPLAQFILDTAECGE